jgi:hypothetical protein
LTFGIRSRIVENLTAVAHAEKKGLKGSRCWVLNLGKCDSAIFARTFTSIIDKTSCSRFTQGLLQDRKLQGCHPRWVWKTVLVSIKTEFMAEMLTTITSNG